MGTELLLEKFRQLYGYDDSVFTFFAPGRVSLIGEHTDYNGGHVFPCALTLGITGLVRKRTDRKIRLYSCAFTADGILEDQLDELTPGRDIGWTRYVKSVIWSFREHGHIIPTGFDFLIDSTLPREVGLCSSAAIEVLTGFMLRELFGFPVSDLDIALLCQEAENRYISVNFGIMNQFTAAMGKKDHAIFLDSKRLTYKYIPLELGDAEIVITNSHVKNLQIAELYDLRRKECARALRKFQTVTHVQFLGDLSSDTFESCKDVLMDETLVRRSRHVVYENQRTIQACNALRAGNLRRFGELMNASHISLRNDYDVSCPEVNFLVELAWRTPGVIGSRMTGGYAGCTVSIVRKSAVPNFLETTKQEFMDAFGIEPEFYGAFAGDGAHRIG
ncbi:MAG: galactokinase [Lachnospiraceae bacterium]|nr:galactokinase [Lachnospiraceae bacterium]